MTLDDLKCRLENRNVRAFLVVVRHELGTFGVAGYRPDPRGARGQSRVAVDDFPARVGAYAITPKKWRDLAETYGFAELTPEAQDLCGVAILHECGALPMILDGDLTGALVQAAQVWPLLLAPKSASPGNRGMGMLRAGEIYRQFDGELRRTTNLVRKPRKRHATRNFLAGFGLVVGMWYAGRLLRRLWRRKGAP